MPAVDDPEVAASAAGLVYVSPEEPGLTRVRRGRGFSYLTTTRRTLRSAAIKSRIERLAIPPAWTDVWICPRPDGHIQAVGRDDRGRRQYRYHDRWTAVREADKFESLARFGERLPAVRRRVERDLAARGLGRERVLALVVRLLDLTLVRVGHPEYAKDGSFGLTTLRPEHLRTDGSCLVLEFVGKGGSEHEIAVDDPALARLLRSCCDLGAEQIFCYRDRGGPVAVRADDVNEYLRDVAGPEATARDFRTWGGTVAVVEDLGPVDPASLSSAAALTSRFLEAVDLAAERLGNTRAVCRASYVHPAVEGAFESGALREAWRRSRRTPALDRAERATLRLLAADGDRG